MQIHGNAGINNQFTNSQTARQPSQKTSQSNPQIDSRRVFLEEFEAQAREVLQNYDNLRISMNHKLRYFVDVNSNELMVEIIDPSTNEVIKQVPSKRLRQFKNQFHDMLGLLFDSQV